MLDRQEELKEAKKKAISSGNLIAFTAEQEEELLNIVKEVAEIDAKIKMAENMETNTTQIKPGTEKLVQLKVAFGNRFSARTGKEINKPQLVVFSYGEWQLFKESFKRLGYQITSVINDPYGDAAELIEKEA